jgi:formiminotetrahydrofolate cyclodeaminase
MPDIPTPSLNPIIADSVETFHRILDTTDTSTGGGAASALVGAMGSALIGMIANLSGNNARDGAE